MFAALPSFLLSPEDVVTVDAGSTGSLLCAAIAEPTPTISWFRNGIQILNDSYSNIIIVDTLVDGTDNGTVQSSLEVCPFESDLSGDFSCQALNIYGNQTVEFQLLVLSGRQGPEIAHSTNHGSYYYHVGNTTLFESPMDTTADISETVSFTCSASGIPLPDISWFKDNSPLDPDVVNITTTTNGTSSISSVLVLSDLVLSDAGQYSCNASHPISGTDIRYFNFTLQSKFTHFPSHPQMHFSLSLGAVELILYPNDTITNVGDSLTFICTASGVPAPTISWYKDMELLLAGEVNITEVVVVNASSYYTVSMLYLCDVQFPDTGMYSCTGSNIIEEGLEEDTRFFVLEAQGEILILLTFQL